MVDNKCGILSHMEETENTWEFLVGKPHQLDYLGEI
jgi:hypothetical protein